MDFTFTQEQLQLRQRAVDFIEREISPIADELDATCDYHAEGVNRIKNSKFFAYAFPQEYGGKGISSVNLCILREEFSKMCTFADEVLAMQAIGCLPISRFGDEVQKSKYLPPLLDGSKLVNFCLTEQSPGSDVAGIQSTARLDGEHYILNGQKHYVSKPAHTDLSIVFAKTDPEAGHRGISAFIVDRNESIYEAQTNPLVFECNIGTITMKDMKVPKSNILGKEGQGMKVALSNLDVFRPTVGASALGMGWWALALALDFAKEREMFGQKLSDFQVTEFKLAEMKVKLDAAALLVYRAAWAADNAQERTTLEASIAKYYATEIAQEVVDQALQIHGGIGLQKKSRIEQLYRAVRSTRIHEGTSEIQLLLIGRELMRLNRVDLVSRL